MSTKVQTVSGNSVDRTKAKEIKGAFYEEHVDCFRINGRWYRINCGLIGYNLDLKSWFLLKDVDNFGFETKLVVGKDFEGNEIFGYTKHRKELFIPVKRKEGDIFYANESLASQKFGVNPVISMYAEGSGKHGMNPLNPHDFPYSLKDYGMSDDTPLEEYFKKGVNNRALFAALAKSYHEVNSDKVNSKLAKQFNSVLGKLTFGVESESSNTGIAHLSLLSRAGMVCLRDGSIQGFELVTFPHKGYNGLISQISQFGKIEKTFNYNSQCSIHIHVAGHTLSDTQLFALFCLCFRVQDEIFEFIHPYKRNIEYLKTLRHEYSEPLKSLGVIYNRDIVGKDDKINSPQFLENFAAFCKFITQGQASKVQDVYQEVPKYRINSRYSWVNFVNFLKNKSSTLEFRCFPPSFDGPTIAVWALICQAIYHYGVNNSTKILSNGFHVKMDDVFNYLLDGLEREDNKEFFALVATLKSIYEKIHNRYSQNYITREVVYSSYEADMKESSKVFREIIPHLNADLKSFQWEDPDPIKKIISYNK